MEFFAGGGTVPYFGVDFLRANSLIVDAAAGRLIHSKSLRQILAKRGQWATMAYMGLQRPVCGIPAGAQLLQRLAHTYKPCATPAGDDRPTCHRQISAVGCCQIKGSQGAVPVHGETGDHSAVQEQLSFPLVHGSQGGRLIATAVRPLPPFEPG